MPDKFPAVLIFLGLLILTFLRLDVLKESRLRIALLLLIALILIVFGIIRWKSHDDADLRSKRFDVDKKEIELQRMKQKPVYRIFGAGRK